jgi:hypothetical protein
MMFEYFLDVKDIDILDPYNMLPIEKTVVYLGERR